MFLMQMHTKLYGIWIQIKTKPNLGGFNSAGFGYQFESVYQVKF